MRLSVRALAGVLLLVGAAVATGVGSAPPAAAHTGLVSSSPADGDVLPALPDRVSLEFGADMTTPAYVAVTGPDGAPVTAGAPVVAGSTVEQRLGGGGDGGYTVAYRVLTADGHWATGQLTFTVGDAPAPAPAPSAPAGGVEEPPADRATTPAEDDDPAFWSRGVVHAAVSLLLFAAAGALLVASRRPPS